MMDDKINFLQKKLNENRIRGTYYTTTAVVVMCAFFVVRSWSRQDIDQNAYQTIHVAAIGAYGVMSLACLVLLKLRKSSLAILRAVIFIHVFMNLTTVVTNIYATGYPVAGCGIQMVAILSFTSFVLGEGWGLLWLLSFFVAVLLINLYRPANSVKSDITAQVMVEESFNQTLINTTVFAVFICFISRLRDSSYRDIMIPFQEV
jgi:hypothetical protein